MLWGKALRKIRKNSPTLEPTKDRARKSFFATAGIKRIREAAALGILDGVTTNPSLMAKENKQNNKPDIAEICEVVKGPVSVEVLSTDLDGMLREGREYAGWHKHVVVKLPTTREGIKGCKA